MEKEFSQKKNRFESLYKLQYKACQLLKQKVSKQERKLNLEKAIKMHNRILNLTDNYDQLNLVNDSLQHDQKLKNKMELRDIKLSTILLRMKAHKKLLNY